MVQSRASTAVLVVLLGVLFWFNVAAGMRRLGGKGTDRDVVREDPGSIAAMGRLSGQSNLYEYYKEG